ncbi:MAG: hypothetical protein LBH00_07170, partial [Planctomycetaceae bacterium]|nr:hypothetical protein [Planctomycetaceae bacterium]
MYRYFAVFGLFTAGLFAVMTDWLASAVSAADSPLAKAEKLVQEGLHKDALDVIKPWILDPNTKIPAESDSTKQTDLGTGLNIAVQSLQQLNRVDELDTLLESFGNVHKNNWRAMQKLAARYQSIPHFGCMIDGQFLRGNHRNGKWVDCFERDRVQTLKILAEALPLVQKEADGKQPKTDTGQFFLFFARSLKDGRNHAAAWSLQTLTDLTKLPDYDENGRYYGRFGGRGQSGTGAPTDKEGNPVYYYVPESFDTAKNDGERWRWALDQAAKGGSDGAALREFADFCYEQFGVQTLNDSGFYRNTAGRQDTEKTANILTLETLADDETVAKLAGGIKRFKLPDEFNFIKLYQKMAESGFHDSWQSDSKEYNFKGYALQRLAEIAKDRRQYPKAAAYYKKLIEAAQTPEGVIENQLQQITGNWGRFEQNGSSVNGLKVNLRYIFRNGKKVNFTIQEIDVEKLIADAKEYIKSKPEQFDWRYAAIDQIAQRLFYGREKEKAAVQEKYLGQVFGKWHRFLKPAENHFDSATLISYEVQKSGAYLIRAEMEDGNADTAAVWLTDTAIVKKQLDNAVLYYVADAETGKPVPNAKVNFFGYRMEYKSRPVPNNRSRQDNVLTWTIQEHTQQTDKNGLVILNNPDIKNLHLNWLVTAATEGEKPQNGVIQPKNLTLHSMGTDGVCREEIITLPEKPKARFAHLGFDSIWFQPRYDERYNEVKTFVLTDRPVYRPKDKVEIKAWIGTAKYDQPDTSGWANQTVFYTIYSPKNGEKMKEQTEVKLDAYGGFTATLELPKDAALGQYSIHITNRSETAGTVRKIAETMNREISGYGSFRVEEYKKPEYEVTIDAPKEPVKLGDKITAAVKAKYYFGSPVSEATVKYMVKREKADAGWYPLCRWDWLFGNGYGWFAYDCDWLPDWRNWGCRRPVPPWFPHYSGPPEIVAEAETKIKPDGTVDVVIDTAVAQAAFPNDDQRYTITAEVIDNSRRTIVGSGTVLVSKAPFKIYAWVDRGYYVPGQKIETNFQTRRLDGKPVSGSGNVKVFRLQYPAAKDSAENAANHNAQNSTILPAETEVHSAETVFAEDGTASLPLTAAEPGQYKISCTLNGQEGGYVFNVFPKSETDKNVPAKESGNAANEKSGGFKFNTLELIPDKAEFAPEETVKLRVNSDRPDATVLLFVKPANGVAAGKPEVLRLAGKSVEAEIPVTLRDMPNFFVEAVTVTGGETVTETKEIVVPPQQRVLNVDVKPSSGTYKPGEKAKAELTVTGLDGKPVAGQLAVSVYDKSVEYISGGSNISDIKEFFWKWRRNHYPQTMSNLRRSLQTFTDAGKIPMQILGRFGGADYITGDGRFEVSTFSNGRVAAGQEMQGTGMRGESAAAMDAAAPAESAPAAAPMAPPPMMMQKAENALADKKAVSTAGQEFEDSGQSAPLIEPSVRRNFADTALWLGTLETDKNGKAQIELAMPESLTTWKINVWTMAAGTRVGYGSTEVITRKDLMIRMQTPRFLIEKDKCVFSANVHNYLKTEKTVTVSGNWAVRPQTADSSQKPQPESALETKSVNIAPNGETRIDWTVEPKSAGEMTVTMKALTDEESDAVEKTLPVYVHGMLKTDSFSAYIPPDKNLAEVKAERKTDTRLPEGTIPYSPLPQGFRPADGHKMAPGFHPGQADPNAPRIGSGEMSAVPLAAAPVLNEQKTSAIINVNVPAERKPEQTKLTVTVSPALAASMIDALPFLADYPYGCTEQTLNRFLPAVIVRKVIGEGWEPGRKEKPDWAIARSRNPVFDKKQIDEMVQDGIERLKTMQCSDGGWGWFGGCHHGSAHLTALVIHGLQIAGQSGVVLPEDV